MKIEAKSLFESKVQSSARLPRETFRVPWDLIQLISFGDGIRLTTYLLNSILNKFQARPQKFHFNKPSNFFYTFFPSFILFLKTKWQIKENLEKIFFIHFEQFKISVIQIYPTVYFSYQSYVSLPFSGFQFKDNFKGYYIFLI